MGVYWGGGRGGGGGWMSGGGGEEKGHMPFQDPRCWLICEDNDHSCGEHCVRCKLWPVPQPFGI